MKEELAVISATPENIEKTLESVIEISREQLLGQAMCSRAYVERWHDPIAIAHRIRCDIDQLSKVT